MRGRNLEHGRLLLEIDLAVIWYYQHSLQSLFRRMNIPTFIVPPLRCDNYPDVVEALGKRIGRAEKAAEIPSERDPYIVYEKRLDSGALEFHIFGLKTDEVAVTSVPFSLYEKVKQQAEEHPGDELFSALQNGAYLSVQNVFPERTGGL